MRVRLEPLIAVVMLFAAAMACTNGSEESMQASPPAEPELDCAEIESASEQQIGHLAAVQIEGNAVQDKGWALKSRIHNNAYYVAGTVVGPGIEDGELGIWIISGDKESPGLINSVNGVARTFSPVIPYAGETGFETTIADEDPKLLRDCLGRVE